MWVEWCPEFDGQQNTAYCVCSASRWQVSISVAKIYCVELNLQSESVYFIFFETPTLQMHRADLLHQTLTGN